MWEPKELRLDWRHPWARTVVESVFSAGCGLGETRVYFTYSEGPRHLRSLSRPCRPCLVPVVESLSLSWSLVWSHAAWSLSRLVWSHSLSHLRPHFARSTGSARTECRQLLRGDPCCIARHFTPVAPTRPSTRRISSLGHFALRLCLNKWTIRMTLHPHIRSRRRRSRAE